MITIHKSIKSNLEIVEHVTKGCWINLIDPSAEELRKVAQDLGLDLDLLRFPLGRENIPRAEKEDGALRILVRIPHTQVGQGMQRVPFMTLPLGILVTDQWVITICKEKQDLLKDVDESHRMDLSTEKPYRFVLHLLWSIANHYLRHLNDINQAVDQLEDKLEGSLQNREVLALLRYQKSLVYFITALETNQLVLERLQRTELLELKREDTDLLDDVITENQEAIKMTQIANDILSQTMDAFASIISNNLNVVMKFLTSITIVLIIPQIFGTFYGMNVGLPIQDHPFAFSVIVGLSAMVSVMVGFIFWKKNWL